MTMEIRGKINDRGTRNLLNRLRANAADLTLTTQASAAFYERHVVDKVK